jgi:hypothetical protein
MIYLVLYLLIGLIINAISVSGGIIIDQNKDVIGKDILCGILIVLFWPVILILFRK